jgi:coenzyme F420-reducing hydrogenase gamma subunit
MTTEVHEHGTHGPHTHDEPGGAHTHEPPPAPGPTLAVWKFASCDGCQLTLLNCEDELMALAGAVRIAYFPEATRAVIEGPYDVSLVEGSITSPEEVERIHEIRKISKTVVTIGACATNGGIQALKNFGDIAEFRSVVYAHPEYLSTLATSTPVSAHVDVDFELRGCPIDRDQLLEVLTAYVHGRRPRIPTYSVCVECKRRGSVCVAVADGTPCLGPVTQAGCGALCPTYSRGCYGCFGPQDTANPEALSPHLIDLGMPREQVVRVYRTFNAMTAPFLAESTRQEAVLAGTLNPATGPEVTA